MIVVASKPGQLGNSLFLFAQFIGCAIENNLSVMNLAFDEHAKHFQITSNDLFCRYPPRTSFVKGSTFTRRLLYNATYYLTRVLVKSGIQSKHLRTVSLDWQEELDLGSNEFLATLAPNQLIFAQGWLFRDARAVVKHADEIRRFFTPLEEYQRNVASLIEKAREQNALLVGVHVRHGDYKTFQGGKYFYELDAYKVVMEKVVALFHPAAVGFLICSNVKLDRTPFASFKYTLGSNHFIEDMYSFSQCDYLIGPPSTYTMWASFYGKVPLYVIEDPHKIFELEYFVEHGSESVL